MRGYRSMILRWYFNLIVEFMWFFGGDIWYGKLWSRKRNGAITLWKSAVQNFAGIPHLSQYHHYTDSVYVNIQAYRYRIDLKHIFIYPVSVSARHLDQEGLPVTRKIFVKTAILIL